MSVVSTAVVQVTGVSQFACGFRLPLILEENVWGWRHGISTSWMRFMSGTEMVQVTPLRRTLASSP